jgi:hypothetical protein
MTSIVWRFCGGAQPALLAFQDGSSAFTGVAAAGDGSFTTPIATNRGAVAFVLPVFEPPSDDASAAYAVRRGAARSHANGAGYTTHVYYGSTAELQAAAARQCADPQPLKTLHGSVAGVLPGDAYGVLFGLSSAIGFPGDPLSFALANAPNGQRDLLAARLGLVVEPGGDADDFSVTPLKMILRRGLSPDNGSTLPLLDFSAAEAFDPVSSTVTFTGTDNATIELTSLVATANGTQGRISLDLQSMATTRTFYGIPPARMIAGDLAGVEGSDNHGRGVIAYTGSVSPFTAAFGPMTLFPMVGVDATAATVRMLGEIQVHDVAFGYGGTVEASFTQTGTARAIVLHYAQSMINHTLSFSTPDLTGVVGWNEGLFGLQRGSPLEWRLYAANQGNFVPAAGASLRFIEFNGQITP